MSREIRTLPVPGGMVAKEVVTEDGARGLVLCTWDRPVELSEAGVRELIGELQHWLKLRPRTTRPSDSVLPP